MYSENELLTFEEGRSLLRASKARMRILLESNEIKAFKIGSYGWRIPRQSIETYIKRKMDISAD